MFQKFLQEGAAQQFQSHTCHTKNGHANTTTPVFAQTLTESDDTNNLYLTFLYFPSPMESIKKKEPKVVRL